VVTVMFYLSLPVCCEEISHIPKAVLMLVHLARDDAYRGPKNVIVSLHDLLRCTYTYGRAMNTGTMPMLIGLLSSPSPSDGDDLTIDSCALFTWLIEQSVRVKVVLAGSTLVACLTVFLGEAAELRSVREQYVTLLASLGRQNGDKVLMLLGKLPCLMPAHHR
jgi:hypothetical protein